MVENHLSGHPRAQKAFLLEAALERLGPLVDRRLLKKGTLPKRQNRAQILAGQRELARELQRLDLVRAKQMDDDRHPVIDRLCLDLHVGESARRKQVANRVARRLLRERLSDRELDEAFDTRRIDGSVAREENGNDLTSVERRKGRFGGLTTRAGAGQPEEPNRSVEEPRPPPTLDSRRQPASPDYSWTPGRSTDE